MNISQAIKHFVHGDESWFHWDYFVDDTIHLLFESFQAYSDQCIFAEVSEDIMSDILDEEMRESLYSYAYAAYARLDSINQTELYKSLSKEIKESFRHCLDLAIAYFDKQGNSPHFDEILGVRDEADKARRLIKVDGEELSAHLARWGLKSDIVRFPRTRKSALHVLDVVDINLYKLIVKQPELLKTMDWRIFELLLADILKTLGYDIELTKATHDGGIDLFAVKGDSEFGVHRYLLQAKRYKNKVQVEPVRSLLFLHNQYRATKSCLATTAHFTKGAWILANNYKWQLELKDYEEIYRWVKRVLELKQQKIIQGVL
jgi:HJR/Mrr/RecB family endonuclease